MKYELGKVVIYEMRWGIVHDYNHRYKEYTVCVGGELYRGIKEAELRG